MTLKMGGVAYVVLIIQTFIILYCIIILDAMAEFILTPAIGDNFIGREKLVQELVEELHNKKSHIGFCLYGRRRVGDHDCSRPL